MTEPVQVDSDPAPSRVFLPIAVLAIGLLLVAIGLSERSVAPIELADDPSAVLDASSPSAESAPSAVVTEAAEAPRRFEALHDQVPGFAGTVNVWVTGDTGDQLLAWPSHLAEPLRMDLPHGAETVDLNADRLIVAVATSNSNGNGVLWLGDRDHVEPLAIFEHPIDVRWHTSWGHVLAVSEARPDETRVTEYRVDPGNVLVALRTFSVGPGLHVDYVGGAGIALASITGQPVAVWLTHDGSSTVYSRHAIQAGGPPIYDICTGVPCRPTLRMYVDDTGSFTEIDPAVVQVSPNGAAFLAATVEGPHVRTAEASYAIPLSGTSAWSSDSRWLAFEEEGVIRDSLVQHPLAILNLATGEVSTVTGDMDGRIRAMWLP